jgi:hypothetical protein
MINFCILKPNGSYFFGAMIFVQMTISVMGESSIFIRTCMLSVTVLKSHYYGCRYAACYYAARHHIEHCYAECRGAHCLPSGAFLQGNVPKLTQELVHFAGINLFALQIGPRRGKSVRTI